MTLNIAKEVTELKDTRKVGGLRPFVEEDITFVASLIWRVLHGNNGPVPPTLPIYLRDLFINNPWCDDGIVSRVYEDSQGKVVGFFGAVPRRMSLQKRTIRIAFGSNFVVDPESRTSMAAVQLVKAFMRGTQDVSMTDSANEMSHRLLRSMGFSIVPAYSLSWARPLRPSQYALNTFLRLRKNRFVTGAALVARPICHVADAFATKLAMSPFRQCPLDAEDEELDNETLLRCLADIPSKSWLLPEYDTQSLSWVVEFIRKRKVLGDIRKALVRNSEGHIAGWYIYSLAPGNIGEVLQIGAYSASVQTVLKHLFYDAWKRGLVGLSGRMEPQFMEELTTNGCFFFRHGSWTLVHSNRPELLSLIQSGTAFFSRLDGEWSFRHGSGPA
jgi:hypothetical protein